MRPLRHLVLSESGEALVEVTSRTVHGRFLMLPSTVANALILGILGRAQEHYEVKVCAFAFLSNHYHLLVTVKSCRQLSRFMRYVNSNIGRKIGRLYSWREKYFSRRYRGIQVSDEEEKQVERLLYILRQGCKEGLVRSPLDWPGVHCAWYLAKGVWTAEGWWDDQTAEYRARLRGEKVRRGQFRETELLKLSPLPAWAHLSRREYRLEVEGLIATVEEEVRHSGRSVLGAEKVLRQDPHAKPSESKREPAPGFHAATREMRSRLRDAYRQFEWAYREAAAALRRGDWTVSFPPDCFPPRHPSPESLLAQA